MARRDQQPRAIVAAATRIRLDDRKLAQAQAARPQEWQAEGWGYFDEVPEIKESIRYLGNQLGKLRLFVATLDPENPEGDPIPVTDKRSTVPPAVAAAATAHLDRLRSPMGGQPEILRMLCMNFEVAGECYLIRWGPREVSEPDPATGVARAVTRPEEWYVRSISEVEVKAGVYNVREGPESNAKKRLVDPEQGDEAIRLWERHPQWANVADSAMRGLLTDCRILQQLNQLSLGASYSRQSAGILAIPNELSFGPATPTEPEEGADAPADPFMEELERALINPVNDPSDASSVMPMVLRGPAEYLKPEVLRLISFGRDAGELESRIEARVQRIARGMNLPVEKVMGHQGTTYANAKQVDQDEYEDYLEPRAEVIADGITFAFARPEWAADPAVGADWAEELFAWFDPAALIASPDTEANADGAFDRNTISSATYRQAKGFSEDDAPTAEELLERAGLRRGILTADLTLALLNMLGIPIDVQPLPAAPPAEAMPAVEAQATAALLQLMAAAGGRWRAAEALGRDLERQGVPMETVRLASARQRPAYGAQLVAIDRDLRSRLLVASNDAMSRALERAGNRLRSRSTGELRSQARAVPTLQVAATLGRALVAEAGPDLWTGAWDDLQEQFMTWGAGAQADAIEVASRAAAGFSVATRDALQLRQAGDLATAWAWMREALSTLADARLFDPDPALPPLGEADTSLRVPAGLVRQAIARAGGATALTTDASSGAWVTLVDGGTRPAGGIGTGELVRDAFRDSGVGVEGYRWVYGPAHRSRPFLPHRELDGAEFVNFDDPQLANTSGFPDAGYYLPGDHAGCICDVEPIVIPAEQ